MSNGILAKDFIHWENKVRTENETGKGTREHLSMCHPPISNHADILWLSPQENGNNTMGAK